MHLPGPLRAAVGLVASAAEEAKHLPDRAIELPMLAVSTALQMSLRAQQRYAMLAARGDAVLNGREAGDEPPPWATFDDDLDAADAAATVDAQRAAVRAHLDGIDGAGTTGGMFEQLFGVEDPGAADPPAEAAEAPEPIADDTVTPMRRPRKAAAKKAPAKKAATTKAATTNAPARRSTPAKAAAKKTTATKAPATGSTAEASGKRVAKPRHTAPSKFDDAGDD